MKEISSPILLLLHPPYQKSIFSSLTLHSHPSHLAPPTPTGPPSHPSAPPPNTSVGPPAANNRLNNPSSHPQTHPGRAPSSFLKEERGANENYRGPRPPPPPSAALRWNVGNSFSRHAPRHHLPGGTHHLAHGICHLEEGGDQSGRNWRERGPPRRIGSLSAHISPFKTFPQSRTDLVGSRLIITNHLLCCQTCIGCWILCPLPSHLSPSSSLQISFGLLSSTTTPCQAFIAAGFDWMLIIKLIKCVTNLR